MVRTSRPEGHPSRLAAAIDSPGATGQNCAVESSPLLGPVPRRKVNVAGGISEWIAARSALEGGK
jgi:hypothetical protein